MSAARPCNSAAEVSGPKSTLSGLSNPKSHVDNIVVLGEMRIERSNDDTIQEVYKDLLRDGSALNEPETLIEKFSN